MKSTWELNRDMWDDVFNLDPFHSQSEAFFPRHLECQENCVLDQTIRNR